MEIASVRLEEVNISSTPTEERNKLLFSEALGETTCTNNVIARSVELLGLAFVAGIIFLFFLLPWIEEWFDKYIPSPGYQLIGKVFLFIALIYVLDRGLFFVRNEIDICDFKDF